MLEENFPLKIRDQKSVWNIQHRKKWILFTTALTLKGKKRRIKVKQHTEFVDLRNVNNFIQNGIFFENQNLSLSLMFFSYVCILLLLCVLLFCRNIINMKNSPAQKKISAGISALLEKNSLLPFFIMYMCKNRFYSTLKNALKNKNTMYKLCTGGTCEREREVAKKEMVKKSKSMFL